MILPGSTDAATAPGGDGYGLIKINSGGTISLTGASGDGAALPQTVPVSKDGFWPFYVPLYPANVKVTNGPTVTTISQYQGSALGWLNFNGNRHAPTGQVSSIKKPGFGPLYPAGFTTQVDVLGSRYVPPAANTRAINLTSGTVTTKGGNLLTSFVNMFSYKVQNKFAFSAPDVNKQALAIAVATGKLTGSFNHPNLKNAPKAVQGVVLQDQVTGRGFFLGTNQSGSFRF